MIKTFAFLIDNLEVQLSIWKSNFILEMAKTISQRLEYFPYTHKKENMDIQIGWKYNINKSSANWNVAILGVSPSLVSRWREAYSFWGISGP